MGVGLGDDVVTIGMGLVGTALGVVCVGEALGVVGTAVGVVCVGAAVAEVALGVGTGVSETLSDGLGAGELGTDTTLGLFAATAAVVAAGTGDAELPEVGREGDPEGIGLKIIAGV